MNIGPIYRTAGEKGSIPVNVQYNSAAEYSNGTSISLYCGQMPLWRWPMCSPLWNLLPIHICQSVALFWLVWNIKIRHLNNRVTFFLDESRFSVKSDSQRLLIWLGIRIYSTYIRERYGYDGMFVWQCFVWASIMLACVMSSKSSTTCAVNRDRFCKQVILLHMHLF